MKNQENLQDKLKKIISSIKSALISTWTQLTKPGKTKPPTPKARFTTENIIICSIVTVVIAFAAMFIGASMDYASSSDGKFDFNYFSKGTEIITEHPLWAFNAVQKKGSHARSAIVWCLFAWALFIVYKISEDPRKTHRKGTEHGSAKWGDKKEIKELADKENKIIQYVLKSSDGIPLFDEDGELMAVKIDNNILLSEEVKLSLNARQHLLNFNILVIGGSGSGKTRFFAKVNIMQMNTSYVITDPKGEILASLGWMLEKAGYTVRVLNLIDMEHSNNYNPFHYVYDNDGNLSEDNVKKMVDVLFKNTKGDGEKEDFWSQKGQSLLEAIVFLLFEESEYNAVIDEQTKKIKPETRDFSHLNFFSVTEKMRRLNYPPKGSKKPDGFFMQKESNETEEQFRERQQQGFLCPLDKDFIELEKRKGETLAGRLYKEVRNAPEETGQSFLSSANVKTFFFNLSNLKNLTCCDNIHLETLGDDKTALFIIIPATNATYNFVAAMMYTQMFDVLSNRANFKYNGTLKVPVRCIMDEFANIGEIPDFDKVIAFVRSMGMSLNVIVQNIAQLKARYEKTWEVITGNCDSLLFLGGQEDSTLKYMSEGLGKETIDVRSVNKTMSSKNPSSSESNSIMGRELMMPNEIATMPISDCIIRIRSHNPFYSRKYPLESHPNYQYSGDCNKNFRFSVEDVKSITLEEYEKQFIKVDTSINSEIEEKAEPDLITSFKVDARKPCRQMTVSINLPHSDDSDDEKEAFAEKVELTLSKAISSNTVEEYTKTPRFGEISSIDIIPFGEFYKKQDMEEAEKEDETDSSVSVDSQKNTEIKNYDDEVSKPEKLPLDEKTGFNAHTEIIQNTIRSIEMNNDFAYSDILGI